MSDLNEYERNKRYIAGLMALCGKTKDDHAPFPMFNVGDVVRHKHRGSVRGNVRQWGREKTAVAVSFGWRTKIEIFFTDQLELVKPRDAQKNQKRKKEKKESPPAPRAARLPAPELPGIFVDASGPLLDRATISAVAIGTDGDMLYYAVECVWAAKTTDAEYDAITLGNDIRINDAWPIYSDAKAIIWKHPASGVRWIPRYHNRIADKLARSHA